MCPLHFIPLYKGARHLKTWAAEASLGGKDVCCCSVHCCKETRCQQGFGREGRVATLRVYFYMQYALLMMPIAAAIEEKLPATASLGSYAKLLSSEAGKRSVRLPSTYLVPHLTARRDFS